MQTFKNKRERSNEFAEELLDLSNKLTGIGHEEIDNAITETITRLGQFLQMDHAFVIGMNPKDGLFTAEFEWCNEGIPPLKDKLMNTHVSQVGALFEKLNNNECVILSSIPKDVPKDWVNELEFFKHAGLQSIILFPVMNECRLVGFIGIDSVTEPKCFAASEVYLLKVWGSMLSALIKNKRSELLIKQNQENFELFFNTVDVLLWVLDLQGNILHHNHTVSSRLSYEPDELIGLSVLNVHPEEVREEAAHTVNEMLNNRADVCPLPLLAKDGSFLPVETRIKFGKWNGRDVLFGVSKDMTERIKGEEALLQAQAVAVKANLAKSEFLTRMSHELRTPLNSILGFTQLLEMGSLSPQQNKSVAHIRTSSDFLLNLINEALDISKIESGTLHLNIEEFSVKKVILEMLEVVRTQGEHRKISFISHFSHKQRKISTDALRFRQIILNLLNNAVKYNREGGTIHIKTESIQLLKTGKAGIRVSVEDTGYGIHPDKLSVLFNPFERIGAEQTKTEGTGLGLAVIKKLTVALDGEVHVKSILHVGSTFWVDLPVCIEAAS